MKYLGCAYYPEYWGRDRVAVDAKLMQEAGINLARIGEFAWCRMEPEEGRFTLDWLHEAVETLGRHGIGVLLCTPTPTPPAWITTNYPDTLLVQADGRPREHGTRRHYCYASDTYHAHTRRIVGKLAADFACHKNVVGWQIDNEPDLCETGVCFCDNCQEKFRAWLKRRYGTLQELNERLGTGFWTMDYTDWKQIRLEQPWAFSGRQLETRRFASEMLSGFILMQRDIIKQHNPDAVVTTNFNGCVFTSLDYFKIFEKMDVACKDLYFDICTLDVNVMIMEQFRSFKPGKKYWIGETGAGMCGAGRPPHPGQFNAWLWSSFAHGGDAHIVFRWRTCLSGQEQNLEGMLEHSGHPGHRYQAIKQSFLEMRTLAPKLGDLPLVTAEAAFVHDYETMWAYQSAGIGAEINYERNFCALSREFYRRNVRMDVIPPQADLSRYKLVVLPSLVVIDEAFARKIRAFVEGGGVVFAQGQLGMMDGNNKYLALRGPDHLQDTFGVLISGGMYLYSCVGPEEYWGNRQNFETGIGGKLGGRKVKGKAATWLGDLEATDCRVLLEVEEDLYAGQPAVVEKETGKGVAIYCAAAKLDAKLSGGLVDYALKRAGLAAIKKVPEHVEVIQRGDVTFVINHLDKAVELDLGLKGEVIRGHLTGGIARLQPFDVLVVRARAARPGRDG